MSEKLSEKQLSKSKQKRLDQKKKAEAKKREARRQSLIWILIGVAIVAAIVAVITFKVVDRLSYVKPIGSNIEYSAMLSDNGFVTGITASDYVTLPEVDSIDVAYGEIEYTDESIDEAINSELEQNKELSTEGTIKDGDTVNIDYNGTVDGVAFEGGSGEAYDLTIGSGSFIEGFESQLIGAKAGDDVEVNITFPDDYFSEEVAGKDAVFAVKINGIYVTPEFNDEYIVNNHADCASTVDEYREYLRTTNEKTNLESYLEEYLSSNTTESKYPSSYIKHLQSVQRFSDEVTYASMNEFYEAYMGSPAYNSFADYVGTDESGYAKSSKETAKETCKNNLSYQAILEKNGVTVSLDDYTAYADAQGNDISEEVENYGTGYNVQKFVKIKALEILEKNVNIIK